MRRVLLVSLVIAAIAWPLVPARAFQTGPNETEVVKVDGIIDRRVESFIEKRLYEAEAGGGLLILQMNTPGTLGVDIQRLADRIRSATIPVVVWVGPPGSLLQGGAVLLLEAAHVALTSPRSGIGPGVPVDLGNERLPYRSGGRYPTDPWPELAGFYAGERGRDPGAAAALFKSGARALTPQQAIDQKVVDDVAQSVLQILHDLNGREIKTATGSVPVYTEGDPGEFVLRFSELGPIDRVLHAVASPSASYVLLVLGLWAIAFELVQPGFGLAGFTGILFAALAVYSFTVLPVSWLGLGLIVAAALLYVLDVRLRNLGLFTILGTAAFAFGSFLLYGKVSDRIDVAPWVIWTFIVGSVVYFGFVLTVAVRSRERAIAQHQSGLVGLLGEAASDLSPEGQVVVKGAMWQGRALGDPIPGGAKVRVRNVEGLVLQVTAVADAESKT